MKYIVKDRDGEYVSGYSLKLGEEIALNSAIDCAIRERGSIYFYDANEDEILLVKLEDFELEDLTRPKVKSCMKIFHHS